jgi:hypothetical protein
MANKQGNEMRDLDSDKMKKALDEMLPNPNPRIVALIDYALDEVTARLSQNAEYRDWLEWAASWKAGRRTPQNCVDVAHRCFERGKMDELTMWHTLGQLAWGAKEACYSAPTSGWLVVCYIADAMVAFGIAFPDKPPVALDRPTIDGEQTPIGLPGL